MQLISAIIPTYNSGKYIVEAIESVLNQTYKNIEIIVVDDGSSDDTEILLKPYASRIKYIKKSNGGPAKARNVGIKASSGTYIAFLDADDKWFPDKINIQVDALLGNRNVAMSYTGIVYENVLLSKKEMLPKMVHSGYIFKDLLMDAFIVLSTVLIRRDIFDRVGYFNEDLITSEDRHLFLKISKQYEIIGSEMPQVYKRIHRNNLSNRFDVPVGTLDALQLLFDEDQSLHPSVSTLMKSAYLKWGTNLVIDSFHSGAYSVSHGTAKKVICMTGGNINIYIYYAITFLPESIVQKIQWIIRQIKST